MAETKWTPGEWRIDARASTHVVSEGERGICSTGGHFTNSVDPDALEIENEANAHLIASAPDLYRALEWAMEQVGLEPRLIRGQNDAYVAGYARARAALAKARGEK